MRDSCVRVRPAHDHSVMVLSALTLLTPAALAFEWGTQGPLGAWRAILAPLSSFAGIAQGAALVSALMRLGDPRFRPGLRRAAELVALALPAAFLCQTMLVVAGGVFAPGASFQTHADFIHLGLAALLCASGTAHALASLRADGHLPLRDGWLARRLDPARNDAPRAPEARRRARSLAFGYLVAYVAATPWLGAHAVAMMRLGRPETLPGVYVSVSDLFLALAAAALMEAGACAREPDVDVLSEGDVSAAAVPLVGLALALGGAIGFDALARRFSPAHILGILPVPLAGHPSIPSLTLFGAMLGYGIPLCLLARRRARADALSVSLASGLALLGSVMDRGGLLTPARAPAHSLAEAGAVVGFAALAGLFVVWSLRAVGFEGATQGVVRRPSLERAVP